MRCWNDEMRHRLFERLDRVDRLLGIDATTVWRTAGSSDAGRPFAANEHEQLVPRSLLPHRNEYLRPHRLRRAGVPIIGDDADDRRPRARPIRAADRQPLPDRIRARQIPAANAWFTITTGGVSRRSAALNSRPAAHRHAQRLEMSRCRDGDPGRWQRRARLPARARA